MIATVVGVIALAVTITINIVAITRFSTKQEVTLASVQSSFGEFKKNIYDSIKDLKNDVKTSIDDFKKDVNDKFNANQQDTAKQLQRLEDKQEKHNNFIERVYINERDISVIKEQIKVENHRIADLEATNK